ncbi:MAG: DNA repair protein RecN [Ruminococcaceae bacterium]|nr:DNA repair protein RecN [Oscillospiraceae bacterium]
MLRALSIKNVAVAKSVNIEFTEGFTVLTGETGAGKSILIDSLELIAGARASKDMVRSGESFATVSAIFDISDREDFPERLADVVDENGEIEIIRKFSADGRSSAKLNGSSIPITALREVCDFLLGISGQSDSRTLTDKSIHINLLDDYAENEKLVCEYSEIYRKMLDNRAELKKFKESIVEKSMMSDILKYQLKEIDAAKLTSEAEVEKLERILKKARDADKVARHINLIKRALSEGEKGSAAYLVERASQAFRQLSDIIDNADDIANRLESIRFELIDMAETASDIIGSDMDDPEKTINIAETRLRQIDRLKNKYGLTVEDILAFRANAADKLDKLESGDLIIDELEREFKVLSDKAIKVSDDLTRRRTDAGREISDKVCAYLKDLDMPKVRFFVKISPATGEFDGFAPLGRDDVTFMISANPGEAPVELGRAASGGELSRTMLSLKCALASKHPSDTYIFDEIDTGISGATSEKMGRMLRELSKSAQVLCVTHSPQIASLAENHLLIRKTEIDGRAESSVTELDREGRIDEITRIIGGIEITDAQRRAASEMLDQNKK